jgi:hypothetical protein
MPCTTSQLDARNEEHLADVVAGYGTHVDLDRSMRGGRLKPVAARWLTSTVRPVPPGCEFDVEIPDVRAPARARGSSFNLSPRQAGAWIRLTVPLGEGDAAPIPLVISTAVLVLSGPDHAMRLASADASLRVARGYTHPATGRFGQLAVVGTLRDAGRRRSRPSEPARLPDGDRC